MLFVMFICVVMSVLSCFHCGQVDKIFGVDKTKNGWQTKFILKLSQRSTKKVGKQKLGLLQKNILRVQQLFCYSTSLHMTTNTPHLKDLDIPVIQNILDYILVDKLDPKDAFITIVTPSGP
jgi:hypothetical protein